MSRFFKTPPRPGPSVAGMTIILPQLTDAAAEAARVVRAVTPDRLTDPTPASEWDVRTAANHLVLWTSYNFELRAKGGAAPEEWQQRDFTAEPGWADAYAAQLDRALAAWSDPSVWEGEVKMGDSSMPAGAVAGMVLLELVLHGWEVARGTGQEFTVPDSVATTALGLVEQFGDMYRSFPGGFADVVVVADDAPALDRALALSGRDPHWTA